jgi:glycosyltransferase involved in cell wall biosynthesis
VLENMGLGTPVVCSAGGGSAEVVGDVGVNVAEFEPRAMARSIAAFAALPGRAGSAGRRMRENFTGRFRVPKSDVTYGAFSIPILRSVPEMLA